MAFFTAMHHRCLFDRQWAERMTIGNRRNKQVEELLSSAVQPILLPPTHMHHPVLLECVHDRRCISISLVTMSQPSVGPSAPTEHLSAGGQGDHVVGPTRHLLYVPRSQRAKHSNWGGRDGGRGNGQ